MPIRRYMISRSYSSDRYLSAHFIIQLDIVCREIGISFLSNSCSIL